MYENEMSEEYWEQKARDMGEALGVDTREGSVYMDTQEGHILRITKFYSDLAQMYGMYSVDSAYGDVLTEMAGRDGITRIPASPSYWYVTFNGTEPPVGTRFLCEDYYFIYVLYDGNYLLEAEIPGEETNNLHTGAQVIPMTNVDGLISATLGSIYARGIKEESDDMLRERWRETKSGPAENGNKMHFKKWCEEIPGIGRARIIPLWGGENTVKAVLFSSDGVDVTEHLVQEVQDYIDPIDEGFKVEVNGEQYIFGDGVGEGVANIGAHFLAVSATPVKLTVTAVLSVKGGFTPEQAKKDAETQITAYLKNLSLNTDEDTNVVVRISMIGSIIAGLESVLDYDDLKINGGTENITINLDSVAVLQEVTWNA